MVDNATNVPLDGEEDDMPRADVTLKISAYVEKLCRAMTIQTMKEFKGQAEDAQVMRVIIFSVLDFSLKINLIASRDVETCRRMVDILLENLVETDEHVLMALNPRTKDQ